MDCRLSFAASLGFALLGCVTSPPPRPTIAEGHACGAPGMLNKVIRDNSVSPELGVKIPQVVPVVGGFEATAKVGIVNKLDANLQQIADSNQRCYFATAVTMCAVSSTDAAAPADKAAWMDLSKTFNLTMERVCTLGEKAAVDAPAKVPSGTFVGAGDLVSDSGAHVSYRVEEGKPGVATYVLETPDRITWWKTLSVLDAGPEQRIETKDGVHRASLEVAPNRPYRLGFWKGVGLNLGWHVKDVAMDSNANLGKRVVFVFDRD